MPEKAMFLYPLHIPQHTGTYTDSQTHSLISHAYTRTCTHTKFFWSLSLPDGPGLPLVMILLSTYGAGPWLCLGLLHKPWHKCVPPSAA